MPSAERVPRAIAAAGSGWSLARGGPLHGKPRWLAVGPGGGALLTEAPYIRAVEAGPVHLSAGGKRTPDADDARTAAWLASAWLTDLAGAYVPVAAGLVVPLLARVRRSGPPVGYRVLPCREIPSWLRALPRSMSDPDAEALARIARDAD